MSRPHGGACFNSDGLLARPDVRHDGDKVQGGLDVQGPSERFAPHGEVETLRCRVQPCSTSWQPVPRIDQNGHRDAVPLILPSLRDNSQQY